jgi:hypothetical protein
MGESVLRICYAVMRGSSRFRRLCATCHEIRKKEDRQAQGARQHKQPARLRRSLQTEGQPVRRIRTAPDSAASSPRFNGDASSPD